MSIIIAYLTLIILPIQLLGVSPLYKKSPNDAILPLETLLAQRYFFKNVNMLIQRKYQNHHLYKPKNIYILK